VLGYLFYLISTYLEETDFPVFYCAAKIALDPATPISKVYDTSVLMGCKVPETLNQEQRHGLYFIYSIPAAYILTPLALLPYFHAKTLIIILDIICYLATISKLIKTISPDSTFIKPLRYSLLACLWLPFQFDIRFAQINSILFFLIAIAAVNTSKRPFLSGFLIGIASLFKLFPLGIALLIGLKNWRVAAACIFTFVIGLTITDSWVWFTEIGNVIRTETAPIYLLINYNINLYLGYALAIIGITVLTSYFGSSDDVFITGFAITSLFAIMPIIEYYHLALLIIPLFYFTFNTNIKNKFFKKTTALPIALITISAFYGGSIQQNTIFVSCIIIWTLSLFHALENIYNHLREPLKIHPER